MTRRPALTDQSFLAAIFRPSKNPMPSGIRRTSLAQTPGRVKRRVNAFNRMPREKQEVLKRTGNRELYLRGQITYGEAKREARTLAVSHGVVPPASSRMRNPSVGDVIGHAISIMRTAGAPVVAVALIRGVTSMDPPERRKAVRMNYDEWSAAASRPADDGELFNPYWYHN